MNSNDTGRYFEEQAGEYLSKQGLTLIATNYTAPLLGEIDIIAKDDKTLVFVEVKARKRSQFGSSIETITPSKQRKIIRTAEYFLQQNNQYHHLDCRFDVIGFDIFEKTVEIHWIQHAFLVA
ncbi:YraN family protein [Moraxella oblonga]|uniref:YraN family protein n=1 Tax=Moraxella oblonga TaxID=200413 RepID=UPI0009FE38C0|nr:YraN family protein [Moraxella oblonga]